MASWAGGRDRAARDPLQDNFEWAYGYGQRFGLVRAGFATQERIIKDSGLRYAEIIRAHRGLAAGAVASLE